MAQRLELEGAYTILSFSRKEPGAQRGCRSSSSQSQSTLEGQLEPSSLKPILVLFPVARRVPHPGSWGHRKTPQGRCSTQKDQSLRKGIRSEEEKGNANGIWLEVLSEDADTRKEVWGAVGSIVEKLACIKGSLDSHS